MKKLQWLLTLLALVLGATAVRADSSSCATTAVGAISCTGSLATPEDVFLENFTVPGASSLNITVQTYGFGGGTNAAGTPIATGGFDSLVALFSRPTETVLTDGSGNPIASADNLFFSPSGGFSPGCPPAGTFPVGSVSGVCGDDRLTVSLTPGLYTLLLSDANYVPYAVNPGPPISSLLSDGYGDLTGGVFQTCVTSVDCNTDTGNFAVDILGLPATPTAVPEPGILSLLGSGLLGLGFLYRRRRFYPRHCKTYDCSNESKEGESK